MTGDPFIKALGKIVAEHRQKTVAAKSGLTQPAISRLLTGENYGNWDTVEKLVAAYPELKDSLVPEST